jgi:predicted TIM-barrel fold metal-dependent hydrolase
MSRSHRWLILLLLNSFTVMGQERVIDMHLHAFTDDSFKVPAKDYYGNVGSASAAAQLAETYAAMTKYHIVKAMVCGSVASLDAWVLKDQGHKIIRGLAMNDPSDYGMDTTRFEKLVKSGKVQVFGEIGAYYAGTSLNDSTWQPYLKICERYDIPVAVHTGGGDPGGVYTWSPKARLKYGDPYLIEDVLVRYPKLRLYIMHSGEDWHEHALRLMAYYPQLYSDLGAMLWVEPLDQRYVTEFLRHAKQAGYLSRVMYGTDQMRWPYAIKKSLDFLNSLTFLSKKDKEDILYNNAARFLRLHK